MKASDASELSYTSGELALSEEEVGKLLTSVTHPKDLALFSLVIATGLRREDAVRVQWANFSEDLSSLKFHEAKKRREWVVSVPPRVRQYLGIWRTVAPPSPYVFPGREGRRNLPMSSRQAYERLQMALDKAGVKRRPFHALRGTFVKRALAAGWGYEGVSKQTGDTVRTLQRHYSTVTVAELKQLAEEKPVI